MVIFELEVVGTLYDLRRGTNKQANDDQLTYGGNAQTHKKYWLLFA